MKIIALFLSVLCMGAYDAQLLHIAPGRHNILATETGYTNEHLLLNTNLLLNFTYKPLSVYLNDQHQGAVIEHRLDHILTGNIGLFDVVDLGVSLSLTSQGGYQKRFEQTTPVRVSRPSNLALGDIHLVPKVKVLENDSLAIAVIPAFTLPVGKVSAFTGERGATFSPTLAASTEYDNLVLAVNLGYTFRNKTTIYNLNLNDEVLYRAGVMYHTYNDNMISPFAEINGRTSARNPFETSNDKVSPISPMEIDVGVKGLIAEDVYMFSGVGVGLLSGYNAPVYRIFLGLNVDLQIPVDNDWDKDGILNDYDLCPEEPEDFDNFRDEDGCPDPDNDQDNVLDMMDKCPLTPIYKVHLVQSNGCALDPNNIEFEFDSANLTPKAYDTLLQLVYLLQERDYIKVHIEGHTDSVGSVEYNQDLSQRRASAVKNYLLKHNIDPDRIETTGYSELQPIAPNTNARGRQTNRRTEFIVIKIK